MNRRHSTEQNHKT